MAKSSEKIRVLIAKPGLDGHDRGAKVIAQACRDAGMEVIYTGLHQSPSMIVNTAVQEDVHVVGVSILSGAHQTLLPAIVQGLKVAGLDDALVVAGGIIPESDRKALLDQGVSQIFPPGTPLNEVVQFIEDRAPRRIET